MKITELTALTTAEDSDLLPIVEIGSPNVTKKILASNLKTYFATHTEAVSITAGSIRPRASNPCASLAGVAAGAGKPDIVSLDFDAAAIEYSQFSWAMPSNWDEGTITAKFYWSHAATATNFGAVWGIQAVAVSNDDTQNATFGTAVTVTDTGGTTDDLYISDATAAMTIAGSPQPGDLVVFQVFRDATAGADNLAVDARLQAVVLFININAASGS